MSTPERSWRRKRNASEPAITGIPDPGENVNGQNGSGESLRSIPRNESTPLLGSNGSRVPRRSSAISPVISENEDSITFRRPVQYYSIHPSASTGSLRGQENRTHPNIHRYKYYNKLAPHGGESQLLMPNHVVPPEYFLIIPLKPEEKQSSLITIFSIWNTMMGTSLLSIPWAINEAGFVCGLATMIIIAGLCFYTGYLILKTSEGLDRDSVLEFSDICSIYLGKFGRYCSFIFSIIAIMGALIVYWVLMSNFIYHTVDFIYDKIVPVQNVSTPGLINNSTFTDVYCPNPPWSNIDPVTEWTNMTPANSSYTITVTATPPTMFEKVWDQQYTVPFFLIILILPLINFKSPTFFTKFNALGTLSVMYMMVFVTLKTSLWGINMNFEPGYLNSIKLFKPTLPSMTGILLLAYFIHSCLISIMRNQKNPENNMRDLSISFACVCFTYLFIGTVFYIGFPLTKQCIEDNLLNNFRSADPWAFVARIWLFFQIMTVYPLLNYVLRVQLMHSLFNNVYPSVKHVLVLNLFVIGICVLIAVFYPHIGDIIRYSGALCGLVYVFALPCLVYMTKLKQEGKLTLPIILWHSFLILLGVINLISQFLMNFL